MTATSTDMSGDLTLPIAQCGKALWHSPAHNVMGRKHVEPLTFAYPWWYCRQALTGPIPANKFSSTLSVDPAEPIRGCHHEGTPGAKSISHQPVSEAFSDSTRVRQRQKPSVPIAQPRTSCLGNLQPKVGVSQSSCHTSLPYGLSTLVGRELDQFITDYALVLPSRDR